MEIRRLTTVEDVITAIGGKKAFAKLISTPDEPREDKHVDHYLKIGFPPRTYERVRARLRELGVEPHYKLFKQLPPLPPKKVRRAS